MAFPRLLSLPRVVIAPAFLAGYVLLDWASYIQPFGTSVTPGTRPRPNLRADPEFGQRFLPVSVAAARGHRVRGCPCRPTSGCSPASLGVGTIGRSKPLHPAKIRCVAFFPCATCPREAAAVAAGDRIGAARLAATPAGLCRGRTNGTTLLYWVGDVIGIAVVTVPFRSFC